MKGDREVNLRQSANKYGMQNSSINAGAMLHWCEDFVMLVMAVLPLFPFLSYIKVDQFPSPK